MVNNLTKSVVIVGGGTSGWITAALLAKIMGKQLAITLVESEQIGTIGVGEATIPAIINLNQALGIDEASFMQQCQATIKLGIQFEGFGQVDSCYMHAFGHIGKDLPFCPFQHIWLHSRQLGMQHSLWDFSLNYQTAKANKFEPLTRIPETNLPGLSYAYHFDAGLYAQFLRRYSEQLGVVRVEGKISQVLRCPVSGDIQHLHLDNGKQLTGQLFIDCSGQHAVLIEQALNSGFDDWSHLLPCDTAIAVASDNVEPIKPYTRAIAHPVGWQWQIPLQHRIGNGYVFSRKYISEDEATTRLLANLPAAALAEPRTIRFKTGRRRQAWKQNCVAIGLSSGFLEPLESTSIHLVQTAVTRLIKHFPLAEISQIERQEYNRQTALEIEQIRDFIILHYHHSQRQDSAFWRDCQQMAIPETLARKIELFKATGKLYREQDDLFSEVAWLQVLIGQHAKPQAYHPLAGQLSHSQINQFFDDYQQIIGHTVKRLPSHQAFLARTLRGV